MPNRNKAVGGQASAIQFSGLSGSPSQSPTLKGTVNHRPAQIIREPLEDVHSTDTYVKKKFVPGYIKMTLVADGDMVWLRHVEGARLQVLFTTGKILTATGVTLVGDPFEIDETEGATNELTFHFASATVT